MYYCIEILMREILEMEEGKKGVEWIIKRGSFKVMFK